MGKSQDALESLLESSGKKITIKEVPYLKLDDVQDSDYSSHVKEVYGSLGGIMADYPVGFRGWDIEANGIAIELDEQLHFNRYRSTTLNSNIYSELPSFPLSGYKEMCETFEFECTKAGHYGGKWTNPSCEKQFGKAGENGQLTGAGAPRWKQRAFYDYVKDLTELIIGTKVVRVSIWDSVEIEGRTTRIRDALLGRHDDAANPIWSLVESRL